MGYNNEKMNEYMKYRYKKYRERSIIFLGGKCVRCGSSENLQFDHIDPKIKSFELSNSHGLSWKRFLEEVKKCQLLCQSCHTQKSIEDMNTVSAKIKHGTLSSYRYCKCNLCREAKSIYNKNYKKTKKI